MATVMRPVIPRVGALIARRPDCLSLAQGMVAWSPPAAVDRAVRAALETAGGAGPRPIDRYGPGLGEPGLLEVVRHELQHERRLDLDDSTLLVSAGSNMAFHAAVQVICGPGDEVILPVPWYFNHVMALQLAGAVPVAVDAGLIPDPDRLAAAISPRCRAIVTISPGNPSGLVIPGPILEAINALCARHGLFHISDEAYAAFTHGSTPHRSPGSARGSGAHTLSLYSLSKAYGMAGWRIGYAALPRQLSDALRTVQDTIAIAPPGLNQLAARAALEQGAAWCRPRVAALEAERRRFLAAVATAAAGGLPVRLLAEPDGAFYGLLEVALRLDGERLMERLVLEHGVAVLPGEEFGIRPAPGRAVLRVSYGMLAGPELERALARLLGGLGRLVAELAGPG
jgi:aspartate/methionine/tyrosine aminotransferase